MDFIKNKILYVLDDDNNYIPFKTVNNEIFLTADLIEGIFSYDDYCRAVRSKITKRVVKIYQLNEDETIYKDITECTNSLSLSFDYSQGQTRTGNLMLGNYNNEFKPSPINATLWKGTKFRIDIGLYWNGTVYWKNCGIFVAGQYTINEETQDISFPIYDKFALLDGTIGGNFASEFQIERGTKIRKAIQLCLSDDKGNGKTYDNKPIIFPSDYEDFTTPYTITKSYNTTNGDILKELADIISCDIYYNDAGNLTLTPNEDSVYVNNRAILWNFEEDELLSHPTQEIDFTKVVNQITVVGNIEGGYQHKATVTNTDAQSQSNIHMTDINSLTIEDTNLTSDELCEQRAKYEIKKRSMLATKINYKCNFIPSLLPNNLVTWTNKRLGFFMEKFIISSIDIDVSQNNCSMDLSISNLKEVVFK